jgi:L-fuculose-phosphate aldolase
VAGSSLSKKILAEAVVYTGTVPLVPFGIPATAEISQKLEPFLSGHDLFLLEFHGALALGRDLDTAWQNMERLEYYARISWNLQAIGIMREFDAKQLADLEKIRPAKG